MVGKSSGAQRKRKNRPKKPAGGGSSASAEQAEASSARAPSPDEEKGSAGGSEQAGGGDEQAEASTGGAAPSPDAVPAPCPDGDDGPNDGPTADASRGTPGDVEVPPEDGDGLSGASDQAEASNRSTGGAAPSPDASTAPGPAGDDGSTAGASRVTPAVVELPPEDGDGLSGASDQAETSNRSTGGAAPSPEDQGSSTDQPESTSTGVVAASSSEGPSTSVNDRARHRRAYNTALWLYEEGYFHNAYVYAFAALSIARKDPETLLLSARLLFSLRVYPLALQTLQEVILYGHPSMVKPHELELFKATRKLSEDGVCTLTVMKGKLMLHGHGDYIGPVNIGFGGGSSTVVGLYASKNFKAKDVIFVERGFLPKDIPKFSMLLRQLKFFLDLRFRESRKLPTIKLFKPKSPSDEDIDKEELDLDEIPFVVEWWKRLGVSRLYPLAGFVNHSCTPNAVFVELGGGETRIYRAIREIKAGEEIRVSYVDLMARDRSTRLQAMNVDCLCERCNLDRQFEDRCPGIEDDAESSHDWSITNPTLVEAAIRVCFNDCLSEEQKSWIRLRYFKDYAMYYNAMYKGECDDQDNLGVLKFMDNFSQFNSGSVEAIRAMIVDLELMERYQSPVDVVRPLKYAFELVFGDQEIEVYRDLQKIISKKGKW